MAGFNRQTIQQRLAYQDVHMTMHYVHLSAEYLQHAVYQLDEVMGELLDQRRAHRQLRWVPDGYQHWVLHRQAFASA
jgi:hypothetical protein